MIRSIELDGDAAARRGLKKPPLLRDLGRVVVFAGPNGAGKSRGLALLVEHLAGSQEVLKVGIPQAQAQLQGLRQQALRSEMVQEGKAHFANQAAVLSKKLSMLPETDPPNQQLVPIRLDYVPNAPIRDPRGIAPNKAAEDAARTRSGDFGNVTTGIHAYLREMARRQFNSEHPGVAPEARAQHASDVAALNSILASLLETHLEVDFADVGDLNPLLFGRPFKPDELSKGQIILLTWTLLLHRQRERLANGIVIIDEPELHLHPAAAIKALDSLLNDVLGEKGQLWIATHSASLLAHFGMESVYYVAENEIQYSSNRLDKVMSGLLGGEDSRHNMRTFLADADDIAFHRLAAQCLLAPGVAGMKDGDPQPEQLYKVMRTRGGADQPLRVLDYGAGEGRMAEALAARTELPKLAFYAYCDSRTTGDEALRSCRRHLAAVNGVDDPSPYFFDDTRKLQAPTQPFDIIVLCNVLHEVPVEDWLDVFTNRISPALADDGVVVIMEDQEMQVGELPHQRGFIVLDLVEAQRLFRGADARDVSGGMGRVSAFEVPKAAVGRICNDTIGQALRGTAQRCEDEIKRIRATRPDAKDFRTARAHARCLAMFASAHLALRAYGGS